MIDTPGGIEQVERGNRRMSYRFRSRFYNPASVGPTRFCVAATPPKPLIVLRSRRLAPPRHRNRVRHNAHHHRGEYFPNEFPGDDWQSAAADGMRRYTAENNKTEKKNTRAKLAPAVPARVSNNLQQRF